MERLTIRSKNSDMVWFKDAENFEVIGNMIDNPELLEV